MISTDHVISKSLLAGVCISIGGYLFLSCHSAVIGTILFSVGLLSCVITDSPLFTSKGGFITDAQDARRLVLVLLLNVFAAFMFGLVSKILNPSLVDAANNILTARMSTGYLPYIIKSIITGFLITLAIESENKPNSNHLILILCVTGFILSGCPHCIADSFYYGASSVIYKNPSLILHLLLVIIFNFIGCNLYNLFVNKSFIHIIK